MVTVSINTLTRDSNYAGGKNDVLRVHISSDDLTYSVSVPQLISGEEEELLRFYLESYAINDVFNIKKAIAAQTVLWEYGRRLLHVLKLESTFQDQLSGKAVILEIQELHTCQPSIHSMHWEVLERVHLWSHPPQSVCVVRTIGDGIQSKEVTEELYPDEPLEIVIVSARPRGVGDVPHRIVSQQIQTIIDEIDVDAKARVHMHVVRPATLDALKNCLHILRGKPKVVHFDLHGEISSDEKTYV